MTFKDLVLSAWGVFFITILLYVPIFIYFAHFEKSVYAPFFPVVRGSDGPAYAQLAKNLLQHHVYSISSGEPFVPNTYRAPGYPISVALILFLFRSFFAVSFIQIILVSISGALIFLMARERMPKSLAFIASMLYVFEFGVIPMTINIVSETLFVFLLLCCVYGMFFSQSKLKSGAVFGIGLLLGFSVLVRPAGLFVPFLFIIFYWTLNARNSLKHVLKNLALFLFGCALVILPWIIRNKHVSGHWGLTAQFPITILEYNITNFLADTYKMDPQLVQNKLKQETGIKNPDNFDDMRYAAPISRVVLKYLKAYPLQYAQYHFTKELHVFAEGSLGILLNSAPNFKLKLIANGLLDNKHISVNRLFTRGDYKTIISLIKGQFILFLDRFRWIAVSIFMLFPLIIKKGKKRKETLFFLALIICLPFLSATFYGAQYRIPAEPFMLILAMHGIYIIYRKMIPASFS